MKQSPVLFEQSDFHGRVAASQLALAMTGLMSFILQVSAKQASFPFASDVPLRSTSVSRSSR